MGLSLADVSLSAAERKALSSIDKDGSGTVCVVPFGALACVYLHWLLP